MSEWKEYKLGDLCCVTSSTRIFSSEYVEYGIPFYRSKEIINKALGQENNDYLYISQERFNEINNKFGSPKKGDILISAVGNRSGIPYLVNEKDGDFYFKDGNLVWFKDFKEYLYSYYLLYWFQSYIGQNALNSIMIGSAQKALTIIGLSNLLIPLPPLKEQQKIAAVLSCLDAKIDNLRRQNETLEKIAQTLFKHWFIDFEFPNNEGKPYKSSGGVMVDSELGEIPAGWNVGKLGDCLSLIIDYRGKTPLKLGMEWSSKGIPALSAKNIKDGKIIREDSMNFANEELYKKWMKDELQKGDVLLTSEAPLGELYLLANNNKYVLSQRLFALRVNEKISSPYLYFYLKSFQGQYLLQIRATGSTVQGIRQAELRKVEIIIPDIKLTKIFTNIVHPIYEKIETNAKQIQTITKMRNELLPKLMSGEIRVKDKDEEVK